MGDTERLTALAADVESAVAQERPPWFNPGLGETVLLPDAEGAGYWVGAPSVCVDGATLLMSYRRRRPRDGSPDERGYRAAIARSTDGGRSFQDIWSLSKQEVGTSSLERCCLRRAPGGGWHLYTSWESPPASGQWRIDLLGADSLSELLPSAAVPVLVPDELGVDAVKDPYVVAEPAGEGLLMYVSTFLTPKGPAPTFLATSTDGLRFEWQSEALGVGPGWDRYQARISSTMRYGSGFVAFYDGAGSVADDTEEHCGLAVSLDMRSWWRLTVASPALASPHATGSLRYVDVCTYQGRLWAYYEYTRPDGSHELRRNELGPSPTQAT